MKNFLYGLIAGALVLAIPAWWTQRHSVHAAVSVTHLAPGRFDHVLLHPNAGSEWSGILDTETGCVWVYAHGKVPESPTSSFEEYQGVLGEHFFDTVPFATMDYVSPSPGTKKSPQIDYSKPSDELSRIARLCNAARVKALESAVAAN